MTLLLGAQGLATRRAAASGPLASLAQSLAADLEPLVGREPFVPTEKALLSRAGGRCPTHGVLLEFDPFTPRAHRCPVCGEVFTDELHYRFWLYWYQLWLAERAVHAATLYALAGDARHATLARDILQRYAEQYLRYPNRDNVLGPTRPFFSTYLESIWLLQLLVACDLLESSGDATIGAIVRDRIVEPSSAIIAEYDEGASNRQVWNNAALFAAYRSLGRASDAERVVRSASGLVYHLGHGLLSDGTWYEGENYHLFAHRGLWYGVVMAEHAGISIAPSLLERFEMGFATPFLTALPDYTLPSRRDSQYAISLRQWRFAELCELGLARRDDDRLLGALHRLYEDDVPRRATGRDRSSAEAERNMPASALSRADLGWRSLLFALPELPPLVEYAPHSALLDAQGLGVMRREGGRIYVALDYGHTGGGHGHPDRLNVMLSDGATRWLDDMGTGSYVDPTLHWYRSTLAHNAPLIDGRSQQRVSGKLLAWDDHGSAGWISARVDHLAPGVTVQRTLVVMPEYVVDELIWQSANEVVLDLPLHVDADLAQARGLQPAELTGGTASDDGFGYLEETRRALTDAAALVSLRASRDDRSLGIWCVCDQPTEWWRAVAPGAPGAGRQAFWIARSRAAEGRIRGIWSWNGDVQRVEVDGDMLTVHLSGDVHHVHSASEHGWQIDLFGGASHGTIELAGLVEQEEMPRSATGRHTPVFAMPADRELIAGRPLEFVLGEPNYRRSEESWEEAGRPTARVDLEWSGAALEVRIVVAHSDHTFVEADAENILDNEHPDINGDGLQLYVSTIEGNSAWTLVPEPSGAVRTRAIEGWEAPRPVRATWHVDGAGYAITVYIGTGEAIDETTIALDVIVNEKPAGRERRRGQLVLSGAEGEFVYLRGDRHDINRLLRFRLTHG